MPAKRRKKKRSLKTVHAQIKRSWTLLENVPAYKTGERTKILNRIGKLEDEQYKILGTPASLRKHWER